jgi:hypothetical protein
MKVLLENLSKQYFVTVDRCQELQDFGAGKINESLAHTQAVSNAQLQQSHVDMGVIN